MYEPHRKPLSLPGARFRVSVSFAVAGLLSAASNGTASPWASRYTGWPGGDRVAGCVRALSGGGSVVAGYLTDSARMRSSGWLMRLDEAGYWQWAASYAESGSNQNTFSGIAWVEEAADATGFIAVGWISASDIEGSNAYGWILRLDADGGVLGSSVHSGLGTGRLTRVRPLPEGGYVATGYTSRLTGGALEGWVLRISEAGSVQWEAVYRAARFGEPHDAKLQDIQPMPGGGYVAVGSISPPGTDYQDGWILALDNSGVTRWNRALKGSNTNELRSIACLSDGNFIVAGRADSSDFGSSGWVAKVSQDGKFLWHTVLGRRTGFRNQLRFESVQEAPDGRILAGGKVVFGSGGVDGLAVRLKPNGDIDWKYAVSAGASEEFTSMDLIPSGGILWAGETSYNSETNPRNCLLARTTSSGKWCGGLDLTVISDGIYPATFKPYAMSVKTNLVAGSAFDPILDTEEDWLDVSDLCTRPNLSGALTLSRSPQSDAVTVSLVCRNDGRDSPPFTARIYFSVDGVYPLGPDPYLLRDIRVPGLASDAESEPYYTMNVRDTYKFAIAVIDPNHEVPEQNESDNIIIQPLP